MPSAVPGSSQPPTITLQWVEHVDCTATVPLDLAREMFGLGGTPDSELPTRIVALTSHIPTLLQKVGPQADELPFSWKLITIDGVPAGDI